MKTFFLVLVLTLCGSAFCEADKYLVLTDGNKEVFCDSVTVTEDGYRAVINGETKEYKFSEAMLKMKSTAGDNSAHVPDPKKVAADKPKQEALLPGTTLYKGKVVPLNKSFKNPDGRGSIFIST